MFCRTGLRVACQLLTAFANRTISNRSVGCRIGRNVGGLAHEVMWEHVVQCDFVRSCWFCVGITQFYVLFSVILPRLIINSHGNYESTGCDLLHASPAIELTTEASSVVVRSYYQLTWLRVEGVRPHISTIQPCWQRLLTRDLLLIFVLCSFDPDLWFYCDECDPVGCAKTAVQPIELRLFGA